jgi:hypothetical protein
MFVIFEKPVMKVLFWVIAIGCIIYGIFSNDNDVKEVRKNGILGTILGSFLGSFVCTHMIYWNMSFILCLFCTTGYYIKDVYKLRPNAYNEYCSLNISDNGDIIYSYIYNDHNGDLRTGSSKDVIVDESWNDDFYIGFPERMFKVEILNKAFSPLIDHEDSIMHEEDKYIRIYVPAENLY